MRCIKIELLTDLYVRYTTKDKKITDRIQRAANLDTSTHTGSPNLLKTYIAIFNVKKQSEDAY